MAYVDSTTNSSNSVVAKSATVPTGAAADQIGFVVVTTDAIANFDSGHYPTGFAELAELDVTRDNQTCAVGWKRLTGADSGTWDFISSPGGSNWVCQGLLLSGRHLTNPPEISSAQSNAANASPVTVSVPGVTALEGDDLIWISCPDSNTSGSVVSHTAPTGFTKQEDDQNAFSSICIAIKENVSAGATGSIDGSFTLSGGATAGWGGFLIRVPKAAAGGGSSIAAIANYYRMLRTA